MEFEITPEPEGEEREAITAALERLLAADPVLPGYRSEWRNAGIRENVEVS